MRSIPERDLIDRIRKGDRSILGQLFRRNEKMVRSYIRNHGGSQQDADDMLQEAIIVLWQNVCARKYHHGARISTYLLGIVKNKWRGEIRKKNRMAEGEIAESTPSDEASPLDAMAEEENNLRVKKGLAQINPTCRELLNLFYFEGRSMDEIAKLMNFAGSDVAKSKKYQCKKALEAVLAQMTVAREGTQ